MHYSEYYISVFDGAKTFVLINKDFQYVYFY